MNLDDGWWPESFLAGGDELALSNRDGLLVINLRLEPASQARHPEREATAFGYGDCVTALAGGDLVVASPTAHKTMQRLRNAPGLPRTASIAFPGSLACPALNAQEVDRSPLVFASDLGDLRAFDVRPGAAPSTSLFAHVSQRDKLLAKAGDLLFVASDDGVLSVLSMRHLGSAAADWPRLLHAHSEAMATLAAASRSQRGQVTETALTKLEHAGLGDLLDALLGATPARRAAAVFNDYAFLADDARRPPDLVERILRRALALDPRRAVAHLNLADAIRKHLGEDAANGMDAEARVADMTAHYRAYLALGGKETPLLRTLAAGDPAQGVADTCAAIAAWDNAGRLSELTSQSGTGLDLHGRSVDIAFSTMGSAHVATWLITDAHDGSVLTDAQYPLPQGLAELYGENSVTLLSLRGQHDLLRQRGSDPVTAFSMHDNAPVCHFTLHSTETVGPDAAERPLCESLLKGNPPPAVAFDASAPIDSETFGRRWNQSVALGTAAVDFANDGVALNVLRAHLESGALSGCSGDFFDLLTPDGQRIADGPQRDLLIAMQHLLDNPLWPVECGRTAGFFKQGGRTYLEIRPATLPPVEQGDRYHRVIAVTNGAPHDVCNFQFESHTVGTH